jgi:hypothetical protein
MLSTNIYQRLLMLQKPLEKLVFLYFDVYKCPPKYASICALDVGRLVGLGGHFDGADGTTGEEREA